MADELTVEQMNDIVGVSARDIPTVTKRQEGASAPVTIKGAVVRNSLCPNFLDGMRSGTHKKNFLSFLDN